jgi:predicted RNA-binding Zn ribbon-like protein
MDGIELVRSGDHPALNFLNTRCRPRGTQLELLSSGEDLVGWMEVEGLLDASERSAVLEVFSAGQLNAVAQEAREVREWLRGEIASWVGSDSPVAVSAVALERLNGLLSLDRRCSQLRPTLDGLGFELRDRRHWEAPRQVLAPVVAAVAELLVAGNRELVRTCAAPRCAIWFYDRTRSHRRRWCSMAVCGNREKVRSHRERASAAD